jgi:phospholipid/cholesterol/gamma-HCH transport system substrate-binding protein
VGDEAVTRARETHRLPSWLIGLIVVVVVALAWILAFSSLLGVRLPWSDGYEVNAVFASAQNVRPDSPVRIAGVNVGKVTEVESLGGADADTDLAQAGGGAPQTAAGASGGQQGAMVTMELEDEALPLKTDATFKLRPRLFLEGNYFVDLHPGSPSAGEIDEGHTFPVNQTSYSPQLDQVLTTLQSDVRRDLQLFLDQFGNALVKHGGAEGLREFYRTSAPAGKFTSLVNESLVGTEPGDLGGVIEGLDRVVNGLGRNERTLQNLVTSFRVVAGSFAAEDVALGQAIERLPGVLRAARPAFANLNEAFPPLRAFAREALPGVRSTPETLRAAIPFVHQIRRLVSRRELRGLVADLRPTIPRLAELSRRTIPFLDQARALSSCFNEVILPWSNDTIQPVDPDNIYPLDAAGRVFEETGYTLTGLTGIGRNGDANGQWGRVLGQSGANLVELPNSFALVPFPILGTMPGHSSSAKTRFTAEHPCETQEPPNLQAGLGNAPSQTPLSAADTTALSDDDRQALHRLTDRIAALRNVNEMRADGDRAGAEQVIDSARRALARLGLGSDFAPEVRGG